MEDFTNSAIALTLSNQYIKTPPAQNNNKILIACSPSLNAIGELTI
jgi:hypothetical protein|tara:strand:+ start:519 stop:656 length:138 start_codon:yes stop_codon:yes gene_type:complete